mgnify:CR=1 FL=1
MVGLQTISGNSSTSTGSIDIFQAAGKTITQAARKIAESISDPDTIGKQALAAATVVLVASSALPSSNYIYLTCFALVRGLFL